MYMRGYLPPYTHALSSPCWCTSSQFPFMLTSPLSLPCRTLVLECMVRGKLPGFATALGAFTTATGALFISKRCFCLVFQDNTWIQQYCPQPGQAPPAAPMGQWGVSGSLLAIMDEDPPHDNVSRQLVGMGMAILAAICNSLAFIAIRAIGGAMPPLPLAFWYNVATVAAALSFQLLQLLPAVSASLPGLFGSAWPSWTAALMLAGVTVAQLLAQLCLNRGFTLTTASRGSTVTVLQVRPGMGGHSWAKD